MLISASRSGALNIQSLQSMAGKCNLVWAVELI